MRLVAAVALLAVCGCGTIYRRIFWSHDHYAAWEEHESYCKDRMRIYVAGLDEPRKPYRVIGKVWGATYRDLRWQACKLPEYPDGVIVAGERDRGANITLIEQRGTYGDASYVGAVDRRTVETGYAIQFDSDKQ
jgi:hypothetical protein